ncbi:solute carrier family 22 member 13 [Takifugu flavidus]|uniref:Solute carrier family 22 member 13 n=1 Tax=Takifugu flavidus TaxID=433684 RepID=A0A5C6P498_9TELE|nr:solute carrier family 22 member 13 [Takifugu flavidus]TWW72947.1 Solute carrier family 22 member 13 [Takifugu flavidus]
MTALGSILGSIGEFGLFQKLLLLGLCLPSFLLPLNSCNLLFFESDPDRRCNTDWILRADPNLTAEEQLNLTVPRETDGSFSRCRMFVPVNWDIGAIREQGLNVTTACTDGWVYSSALYDATIVTDFDLVCDRSYMVAVVQTVFLTGMLAGSFLFGPAAESCGRRRATQLPVVLGLVAVIAIALSPNLYIYLASLVVVGVALGGYRINAVVLATEWIGASKRSWVSCLSQGFFAVGQCAAAGLVYVIRDWRKAQYVLAGGQASIILYIWCIPESARWLLGRGRTEEAKRIICKVAAINKKEIPEELLQEVTAEQEVKSEGIMALFTSPLLMKYFSIAAFAWFSINLGYSCLALNVGKFGLSIFLVQMLFGVTEIPAHLLCIWFVEVIGRRKSLMSALLAGGFFCLLTLAFPQENAVAITALVTTGKFLFNSGGSVCMIYMQEMFPTSIRQTAVGLGSICFRIASLLSPTCNMLAVYHWSIPIIVFSSLAVLSGALVFFLPETARKELPDSTNEAVGNRKGRVTETGSDVSKMERSGSMSTKL